MTQTQTPPPDAPPAARVYRNEDRLSARLGMVALELAVLGAAWYLLPLPRIAVGAIAAVIIVGGIVPYRYGGIVSGIGLLGLAAGAYFYVQPANLAILLAIFGLISLAMGIPRLKGR